MPKELKIGILGVVSLLLFYFGMNFLKGSDVLSGSEEYYVIYEDIGGLATSNRVMINGFGVGLVSDIEVLPRPGSPILVELTINNSGLKIGKGSRAILMDDGLVGGKIVKLDLNVKGTPLEEGDTLIAAFEGGIMDVVSDNAEPLSDSLTAVLGNVNKLLREYQGMSGQIENLLAGADQTTRNLNGLMAENRANLKAMTQNLNALTAQLVETSKKIDPLMDKMNTTADSLNALPLRSTIAEAQQLLASTQQMVALMQSPQGSVGKLLTQDSLHQATQQMLVDLDKLLVDMRQNPKRYVHFSVFGRKDKEKNKKKDNEE